MTLPTEQEPGEQKLRVELLRNAPRPSDQHNDLIMQAARAKAKATREAQQPKGFFNGRLLAGLAFAASVCLAIVVLAPTFGERPATTIERSEKIVVVPADGAILNASPARFEWPASTESRRYQVNVYNDSAELLWSSSPVDTSSLEIKKGQELPSSRYFWTVDLLDGPKGRQLGPFWFRVK